MLWIVVPDELRFLSESLMKGNSDLLSIYRIIEPP